MNIQCLCKALTYIRYSLNTVFHNLLFIQLVWPCLATGRVRD